MSGAHAHDMDSAALERILRRALALTGDGNADPAFHAALREVAARRRGWEFSLNPVVVEMVRAVLRPMLLGPARPLARAGSQVGDPLPSRLLMEASAAVARSLYDDPHTQDRLRRLWHGLGEEA